MKKKRGFTLIELIIAITIFSIAMVGIGSAIVFGVKISAKNTNKTDTGVYSQYLIQTFKSQGKNFIETEYDIEKNLDKFLGYCYFNTTEELDEIIENHTNTNYLKSGSYDEMIGGSTTKEFGAYIEFLNTKVLGKTPGGTGDINLQSGFDNVRIYVKVVKLKEIGQNDSDLIFYLGR